MSDDAMRIVELCDELEKSRRYYLELDDYRQVLQAEIERVQALLAKDVSGIIADTIERCAQVAEQQCPSCFDVAAAIRALKDEP
jgi:hypothetical protein